MPSSRYLARDAVRLVVDELQKQHRGSLSILELGPGTGTFTERILPNLKEGDRFDAVELNAYFYNLLRKRFRTNGDLRLHHQDFLTYSSEYKYDFVISSLPYEQIPASITRSMWEHKLSLCKPGSFIVYYKYMNFNHFRSLFEKQLVRDYCSEEKIIFLNMPPARLFTLKIDEPEKCLAIVLDESLRNPVSMEAMRKIVSTVSRPLSRPIHNEGLLNGRYRGKKEKKKKVPPFFPGPY